MGILMNNIRDTVDKLKIGEEKLFIPNYETGIDIFDYRNGRIEDGKPILGVDGGRILMMIGKSGTGKSTLAIQFAKNIVEPYQNSQIIHFDYERASNKSRIQTLTGWSNKDFNEKYLLLNSDITSESLYKFCKSLCDMKNDPKLYDELKIDSGRVDEDGNKIYILPPSVVIVDSWASLIPKDIEDEQELSGSMSASAIAKTNNAIIKRLSGSLEKGNIILIIINHITQKIEIGFQKTQAQINYLNQDESLPGGSSLIFLSSVVLKLISSTKLEEDEGFGIKGFQVIGLLVKSRSNEAGRKFVMVFNQSTGFDNLLSNFMILKDNGYLKGSPRGYYFEGCDDVKFTMKTFKEKYNNNKNLQETFDKLVKEVFINFIPRSGEIEDPLIMDAADPEALENTENIILLECVNEEEDIWLANDGQYYSSEGELLTIEEE